MSWIIPRFRLVLISDLLEDQRIDDVANNGVSRLYDMKQIDSKLPWVSNRSQKPSKDEVYSFLLRWSNFGCGSRCFICVLRVFRWKGRLTEYAMPGLQLFCSHHILLHLFIYYWTDQQHLGLYLPVKFDLVIMYKEYSM